jgi:hypothetical protein
MNAYEIIVTLIAIILIGFSLSLFYILKAFKVGILWSILLAVTVFSVARMHCEIKYYILTILPFSIVSVIYMMVKLRIRVNETIKRLDEREKEEVREARMEKIRSGAAEMAELYRSDPELKEWNEFVGDYYESSDDYIKEVHHEQKNV